MRWRTPWSTVVLLASQCAPAQVSIGPGLGLGTQVQAGQWITTSVKPADWQGKLSVTLSSIVGNADLYVRRGAPPTLTSFDFRVVGNDRVERLIVSNTSNPPLTSDTWYIGVTSAAGALFRESHSVGSITAQFPGNGAVCWPAGTTFRTFAPFASKVNVAGQFNNWSPSATQLVSEGNGWYSIDYRNARSGQQYKFYVTNGSGLWRNDPWARRLTNSAGNSVIYDEGAYSWQSNGFQTPSWNKAVVYEMHVGAFNPQQSGHPGTFASAALKLDYLKALGVNMIELMPVQEFPGDYSWGYNPSYPWSVESAYGGPDGLKSFIDQANARGMGILLDVVHNHYGPNDMDLWRYDGWYQGQWGGVFFYNDQRGNTPWGWTRPDYGRGEVRSYIRDNMLMWANDYRVSGFRWDSTLYMRITDWGDNADGWSLLQWLNDSLDATQPWKINIAEDMQNNSWITKPTNGGGAGFDSQWSNYVHTVRAALTTPDDGSRDMNAVASAISERFNGDAFQRVVYTENHDEDANGHQRLPNEIDVNDPASYWAQKRSTLGAALTLTVPGIPMLFQGQEFLESGWFDDDRPLDWTKTATFSGILQMYRDLIALRTNATGHSAGLCGQNLNLFHVDNNGKVIAFHRWDQGGGGDDVLCVFNFKNTTYTNYRIGVPRSGSWTVAFNSDWTGYSPLFGNLFSPNFQADAQSWDGLPYSGQVNLAPYSCLILTKD